MRKNKMRSGVQVLFQFENERAAVEATRSGGLGGQVGVGQASTLCGAEALLLQLPDQKVVV